MRRVAAVLATVCAATALLAAPLDDAVARMKARLDRERARIAAEKKEIVGRLDACARRRAALERELSTLRDRLKAAAEARRESEESLAHLDADAGRLKEELTRLDGRLDACLDGVKALLSGGPEPACRSAVEGAIAGGLAAEDGAGKAGALFAALDLLGRAARTFCREKGEVVCDDGKVRGARFLVLGLLARLYLTEDDSRAGLMAVEPRAAGGWEYVEARAALEERVRRAFSDAETKAATVTLPVDASRRVPREALAGGEGLWEHLSRGGVVMVPIGLVALLGFILVVVRVAELGRRLVGGASAEAAAKRVLADRAEAAERLRRGTSAERVMAAVAERWPAARDALEEAAADAVGIEATRMERFLGAIAVCATVSPLLGLLGTVTGMIRTFESITAYGAGDVRLLAGGIREALVTTEAGLFVAIPLLLAHAFLSGRVERLTAELEHRAAEFIVSLTAGRGSA